MLNTISATRPGRDAGDLRLMEDLQRETQAETELKCKRRGRDRIKKKQSVRAWLTVTSVKVRHPKET